jgi:hypothetical protein
MNAIEVHREGLRWGYELLELVMEGVTEEIAHAQPPGTANPLAATYAHAVTGLEAIPSGLLQGKAPLFATTWKDRTGISEPQLSSEPEWARRVRVDLGQARTYGKAAFEYTDAWIAGLTEAELAREVDLTAHHLGVRTVSWCITALIVGHLNNMAGEISVLKGIEGEMGYPF